MNSRCHRGDISRNRPSGNFLESEAALDRIHAVMSYGYFLPIINGYIWFVNGIIHSTNRVLVHITGILGHNCGG